MKRRLALQHDWALTPGEARSLQKELAAQVDSSSPLPDWGIVAAADVSYNRGDTRLFAAVVLVERDTFRVVEQVGVEAPMDFPYVPGLLSFREAPGVLKAFERIRTHFDIVLCDGQGIAHPRRLGIASHVGLWIDKPTIGCAKSRLCGTALDPGIEKGDRSPLIDHGEVVGAVLRTKRKVSPLYISPGHRCDVESAVQAVLTMTTAYRLPQPARFAHEAVNNVRREAKASE